jgi:hypothetical protein
MKKFGKPFQNNSANLSSLPAGFIKDFGRAL